MHHFDYEHVAELREKFVPYTRVEEFVNPSRGDIIVDIGAGDGFYSVNFAKKIGGGKVIAVEIDERGISLINDRMTEASVSNVEIMHQNVCEGIKFKGFNKVFFSNTFHDIPCHDQLLDDISKNSGERLQVILIEFKKDVQISGPPMEIRISEEELKNEFQEKGFKFSGRVELRNHYLHRYVME